MDKESGYIKCGQEKFVVIRILIVEDEKPIADLLRMSLCMTEESQQMFWKKENTYMI